MGSICSLNINKINFQFKRCIDSNFIYKILNLLKFHVLHKILRLKLHVLQKIIKFRVKLHVLQKNT